YLQGVRGFSPKTAGMLLIIQTLVQCILSPVAGRLADRIYPGRIATFGMAICTAGLICATSVNEATSIPFIIMIFILMGIGYGLFSSPNITVIMNSMPVNAYGQASSLAATMRTLGMLTSMTISSVLIVHHMGHQSVGTETAWLFVQSMQSAMMLFAVMGFVGVMFSMGRVLPSS
ncbi:MAG: MFS transporter, partial [Desulfamplus sp.]|nr:MFS transporter [Desulfamplus sp.]